jgi:hypothetical protein
VIKRSRSSAQQPPRLYPIHHATRQRTAEYVDCDDGSCGFYERCICEPAHWCADHPARLASYEEVAWL